MGRFRAEAVIVRQLPDITVVFWDSKSIYVYPKDGRRATIFNRWYEPLGSYQNYWGDFRRRMLRRKHLSYLDCFELAATYGALAVGTDRQLDLSKVKVEYRS